MADKKEKHKKEENIQIKKSEFDALKNKADEYYDKYLRLQAEFDNTRKRQQRQQDEFMKYANEGIILEMLGVLDDLERSVTAREEKHQDAEAFLKGVEMILSHLYEMLKKHDVKPIEAKGAVFDPHLHEALMQVEDDGVAENTVVEEMQKGYLLGDRVIRTAKVRVATAKTAKNPQRTQKNGE